MGLTDQVPHADSSFLVPRRVRNAVIRFIMHIEERIAKLEKKQ